MQVAIESLGPLERKMTISLPAEEISREISRRLQQLQNTAKIPGFRPGKAPMNVVRQHFAGIEGEVIERLAQSSFQNAIREHQLHIASTPHIEFPEAYEPEKPLNYIAKFEVMPEVDIKPFGELIVEKTVANITDEDLQKTFEGMQKQRTVWKEVTRPAQNGDRLALAFEGTIDGEPFAGGKSDNMPLILGSKSTIAGFEDGLLNTVTGQQVELNLVFPENYGAKELAGKPVKFDLNVLKIEAPELPELNDAFAEFFGITEGGIEKLRGEVRETLEKQLNQALLQKTKADVMAKLSEAYRDVAVPVAFLRNEAERLREQLMQQFAQYQGGKTPEFPIDMFMERAKERVILGLVVNAIVKRDQLKPDPARVRTLIENMAERFDHPEEVIKFYYSNNERLQEIESLALEDAIVEAVLKEATVVEKIAAAADVLSTGGQH